MNGATRYQDVPKHPQANLYPFEIVTLAMMFAVKGVGNRAFYRWVQRDFLHLFSLLLERTRLFRCSCLQHNCAMEWIVSYSW
jgi:hypothetical protein